MQEDRPQALVAEANRLYWLNNGPKAAPLYARAEKLFADEGDGRNELYAKVGYLRSEAETMSFVELSSFLNEQLQKPMVRDDAKLRLWCLVAKERYPYYLCAPQTGGWRPRLRGKQRP